MIDPGTAMLLASAVSSAASGAGEAISGRKAKKAGKLRAKEMNRETYGALIQDALQRNAELEAHGLSSRSRLGKRSGQSMQETADLVRGAFNI
jgi:hypothetical protein